MTASDEGFGAAIGELRDRGSHGGGQCGEQDAHEQALLLVHDSVPQLARAIGWTLAGDELVPHQSEQLAGHEPRDGRQREFDGLIAEGVGVVQTLITHGIHFLVDSGEAFDDPIGA